MPWIGHPRVMEKSLLSWNIAGKVRRMPEQFGFVEKLRPDLVCLQEVRPSIADRWAQELQRAGWKHVALGQVDPGEDGRRPLSVLTAASSPLAVVAVDEVPWPERVLSTAVDGLELVNVHSPISPSPGLAKVLTHEAVHRHLAQSSGPRVLCGDLNTPRREYPDGRVWTFARTSHGHLRPDRGERWDRAELALIKGLEPHGFRDAFRMLYGLERRELSWQWQRWGGGYRLDHLIVSSEVTARQVTYLHDWSRVGLSDHAALFARIEWSRP